jgi:hypothetical protein
MSVIISDSKIVVDIYLKVIRGKPVNWANVAPVCLEMCREIEQVPNLKGPEKLSLLQEVLRKTILLTDMSDDHKKQANVVIDDVVPVVVQGIIIASKIPVKKYVAWWHRLCCSCKPVKCCQDKKRCC